MSDDEGGIERLLAQINDLSDDDNSDDNKQEEAVKNRIQVPNSPESNGSDQINNKPFNKQKQFGQQFGKNKPQNNFNQQIKQRGFGNNNNNNNNPNGFNAEEQQALNQLRRKRHSFSKPGTVNKHKKGVYRINKDQHMCPLSGLRISNRKLSPEIVKLRLRKFKILTLEQVQKKSTYNSLPESWAFFGIIGEKLTKTSSKGNAYVNFSLTDFKTKISVFVFKNDLREVFYKWIEGTVVIVNTPKVLDSKKGSDAVALVLENQYQMIEVGESVDLGFCVATKKDGRKCNAPVNKTVSTNCTFHLNRNYRKQSRRRSDVNRSAVMKPQFGKTNKNVSKGNFTYKGSDIMCVKRQPKKVLKTYDKIPGGMMTGMSGRQMQMLEQSFNAISNQKRAQKKNRLGGPVFSKKSSNNKAFSMMKLTKDKIVPQLGKGWDIHHALTGNKNGVTKTNQHFADLEAFERNGIKKRNPNVVASQPFYIDRSKKNKGGLPNRGIANRSIANRSMKNRNLPPVTFGNNKRKIGELQTKPRINKAQKRHRDTKSKSGLSTEELDKLLNRKSKHGNLLEADKIEKQERILTKITEEENIVDAKAKITHLLVKAWVCKDEFCPLSGVPLDKINSLCKAEGHRMKQRKVEKYFFKCRTCGRKENQLIKEHYMRTCRKCGNRLWDKASCYNINEKDVDVTKRNIQYTSTKSEYNSQR